MSEEKNKTDLKDEDLKKVTGGGGKLQFCTVNNRDDVFDACPHPETKGKCAQCSTCSLK